MSGPRFHLPAIVCLFAFVAMTPALVDMVGAAEFTIQNSLPQDELAKYSDSFDKWRDHLWEKGALAWEDQQAAGFKAADTRIEDGRLAIETKSGGFSKGGLASKYKLGGDFDIQIDCDFEFLPGRLGMDQVLIFTLMHKGQSMQELDQASVMLLKPRGKSAGVLMFKRMKGSASNLVDRVMRDSFQGTLRLVRIGGRVEGLFKSSGFREWTSLGTLSFTTKPVTVGFAVTNFGRRMKDIKARQPLYARFDNFRINSAQKIIESDI